MTQPPGKEPRTDDREAPARLDAFPYRHRLGEVMRTPPVTAPADESVENGARRLAREKVSSLLIVADGAIAGIVTENDVLRAIAQHGGAALDRSLGTIMSAPVEALPEDAFAYRAIGRMGRRGIRHLAVTGADGGIVGMITARQLLKRRVAGGLALGDAIDGAGDAAGLRAARDELPALAGTLLAEGLSAREVAGVISAVLRDVSARAAALAAAATEAELGAAPSRWCYLVLGSGGRGESLLAADQDNALIHDAIPGGGNDAWFAALGRRASDILDAAGIPYCKGGIMAANAAWRGDGDAWQARVSQWLRAAAGEALLNADIFFDFRAVHGAHDLADGLRRRSIEQAARSPLFLNLLAENATRAGPPLTLLGRFRTEQGRVDLKKGGLMLLTGAVRVLALKHAIAAAPTRERLDAIAAVAHLPRDDLDRLVAAQEILLDAILRQQLADIAGGLAPSTRVDVHALARPARARLKAALGDLAMLRELVAVALK